MAARQTNPDFLNGVPELLILHLLSARAMYGYQLVQSIRLATNEVLEFGEGCVYPILHRLEADGLLAGRRETVGGRNRVVYRVTTKGAKRLQESVATWRHVVGAVQGVLKKQGDADVQPALA
jgi:PadR family transcriptional regulator PadR